MINNPTRSKKMTLAQWQRLPKDYKGIKNNERWALYMGEYGTTYGPVHITDLPDQKE